MNYERTDLLRTKLMPPRLGAALLDRPHLFERLDQGLAKRMTLIAAPTGCGKSTLVGLWLARRQIPAAWFSLDEGDNDPVRFWHYLIRACQMLDSRFGKNALAALRSARQPSFTALLTGWINELEALEQRVVLVLEDFHHITAPEIQAGFSFLIEHLPENLHLVLITRSQPGGFSGEERLPLALLRARNELNELHAADLQFTLEESTAFLAQALDQPVEAQAVRRVQAKTEGWPAGLRLVALAIHGSRGSQSELGQVIETFSGEHRYVLEYLVREALERQPAPLRAFLLQTCFLNRLTGSLCDAVTERASTNPGAAIMHGADAIMHGADAIMHGADAVLDQLDRSGFFLIPLYSEGGRRWYRYHALFAEAARHHARLVLGEPAVQDLQARASQWYVEHDLLEEAVETALVAGQFLPAAAYIERFLELRGTSEVHTLRRWYESMPDAVTLQHPELCFSFALAVLFTADRFAPEMAARLTPLLDAAEAAWQPADDGPHLGRVAILRANVAWWQGDLAQAFPQAQRSLDLLPESEVFWRGSALIFTGYAAYLQGDFHAAQDRLMEARAMSGAAQNIHGMLAALQILGELALLQGELEQAGAYFQQVLADAVGGDEMLDDQALAWLGLAKIQYEQNNLQGAEQLAERAYQLGGQRADETMLVRAAILRTRARQASGQGPAAQADLQGLVAQTRRRFLVRELYSSLSWLSLQDGDLVSARHWQQMLPPFSSAQAGEGDPIQQESEALLAARLLLAEGRPAEALDRLAAWQADAQAGGRTLSSIQLLCLEASACYVQGDLEQALSPLAAALTLAYPRDLRRVFLDQGEHLARLLQAAVPKLARRSLGLYATALLHAFPSAAPAVRTPDRVEGVVLVEPLSPQELRVLRLIAAGRSNPEIAQELVVSINTIKTQVRSIYRKLNVETRPEAREAARALRIR